jgi:hypothetical protein
MRALSIRQPHAEAIMRGVKKVEYRSRATRIRGRIYIYATLGRYPSDEEEELMAEYGIQDVTCDELPRRVLIGTVELYDCDEGDWKDRDPERAEKLLKPTKHPQPVWFNPIRAPGSKDDHVRLSRRVVSGAFQATSMLTRPFQRCPQPLSPRRCRHRR